MGNEFVMVPRELAERIAASIGYEERDELQEILAKPSMRQGEPVAWVHPAYLKPGAIGFEASVTRLADAQVPLYTHADPGEVERLRGELEEWKRRCQYNADTAHDIGRERDTLRTQLAELRESLDLEQEATAKWQETAIQTSNKLAERDALLKEVLIKTDKWMLPDLYERIRLSLKAASAEPSAIADPHGCNKCTHPECGKFDGPHKVECRAMADNACARPDAEPSAPEEIERVFFKAGQDLLIGVKSIPLQGAPVEIDERTAFDPIEWLETEISAVDTWYRGSPSYEHDAEWMKDQALRLVSEARAVLERKPPTTPRDAFSAWEPTGNPIRGVNGRLAAKAGFDAGWCAGWTECRADMERKP